jgi:hypothetical protein
VGKSSRVVANRFLAGCRVSWRGGYGQAGWNPAKAKETAQKGPPRACAHHATPSQASDESISEGTKPPKHSAQTGVSQKAPCVDLGAPCGITTLSPTMEKKRKSRSICLKRQATSAHSCSSEGPNIRILFFPPGDWTVEINLHVLDKIEVELATQPVEDSAAILQLGR